MDEVKNERDAEFLMDAVSNSTMSDCCYAPMTEFDGTHGRCTDCKEMSDVAQPDDHDCHAELGESGCTHASHMRRIPVEDANESSLVKATRNFFDKEFGVQPF